MQRLQKSEVVTRSAVRPLRARAWWDGGSILIPAHGIASGDEIAEALAEVLDEHDGDVAVWLETELTGPDVGFFHEYIEPWDDIERPFPDWSAASSVLECLGIESPGLDHAAASSRAETRLLAVLPQAYEIGLPRIWREFSTNRGEPMPVFPAIGFWPCDAKNAADLSFWAVPVNIGVVERAVITVRYPGWLCEPAHAVTAAGACPVRTLDIPNRYLPVKPGPNPEDIAYALAVYLAASARAISERARPRLRDVESAALTRIGLPERAQGEAIHALSDGRARGHDPAWAAAENPPPAGELLWEFRSIFDVVQEVDRLIARLLRRLGTGDGLRFKDLPELRQRYEYALEEVRSLQADLRDTGQMITGALAARHLETTQRHQETIDRFERAASLFASLVLIPTLIAGIYGANVELPGANGTNFVAMLMFMVFGSISSGTILRRFVLQSPWTRWMTLGAVVAVLSVVVAVTLSFR